MIDSTQKDMGNFHVECDKGTCQDTLDIEAHEWYEMIAKLKKANWCTTKRGSKWFQFCPEHNPWHHDNENTG